MEWALYMVLLINNNQQLSVGNIYLNSRHGSYEACVQSGKIKAIEMNESIPITNVKTHIYGYDCKSVK